MPRAVLLDLLHGRWPSSDDRSPLEESEPDAVVFLLCGKRSREANGCSDGLLGSCRTLRVLDSDSTVECLYRFKQNLDQRDLSSVTVYTTSRGRKVLVLYQEQLFTGAYTFEYKLTSVDELTRPSRAESGPPDPPGGLDPGAEVSRFLQQLPSLKGGVQVLKSTLIPDCFGHGFSCRTGGVSYIPTLSSLNLFASSRRRDPGAVVMENRRRLGLHAGFDPRTLRLVKVNHASDVWVLGQTEPESYDGMVTDRTGLVLGAPGADCMPILFADPVLKVIGAAHAGWRGTLMGVAPAVVDAMVTGFGCRASDVLVAVGPSVGACCFTLLKEQALDFISLHPDCVPDPGSDRPHVDIRRANRILLQKVGVLPEHIHDDTVMDRPPVTPCTSCHPELFFSHVRDGSNFGTQLGFLWIREPGSSGSRTGCS